VFRGERREPLGLGDLLLARALGFHVHRLHHVVAGRVAPVVLRQVVALQLRVVAKEKIVRPGVLQPRVLKRPAREVPQVVVRVYDRQRLAQRGLLPRSDHQALRGAPDQPFLVVDARFRQPA
jgi:hypothetical protein